MMTNSRVTIRLNEVFEQLPNANHAECVSALGRRDLTVLRDGTQVIRDSFSNCEESSAFVRWFSECDYTVEVEAAGGFLVETCPAGGWLLRAGRDGSEHYWIPQRPMLRSIDCNGKVVDEKAAEIIEYEFRRNGLGLTLNAPAQGSLDFVAWRIPSKGRGILGDLRELVALEYQPIFMWGSHSTYKRPVDLYAHLIFGYVYENRFAWPYNRKICSENDAHALYVTLSGLQRATGKRLYALLKEQLLLSVLARQSTDGGWHHGEWTEEMEAHLRLNGSAIHLLLDLLEERDDPAVRRSLERAVKFVSRHKDETAIGTWLLHDSLELSVEGMNKAPFRWQSSRALGKSQSNMLVLNTHLDSSILLDRYRQVCGDSQYRCLVESATLAVRTLLSLRPLEFVYRIIFQLIRLNFLPKQAQRNLPLPMRAVKRMARNWLCPNLYRLTARNPRLVMPGGYIERAVALRGIAVDYHSINVMDLARFWRRFPEEDLAGIIDDAVRFVQDTNVYSFVGETKGNTYALAFWAEALYHLYLLRPDQKKLSYLADVVLKLGESGMGLPPSLLGANAEAIPLTHQIGCPSPGDVHLRVVNLSRMGCTELLVVNPTPIVRRLTWESVKPRSLEWEDSSGAAVDQNDDVQLPAYGWLFARGDKKTGLRVSHEQTENAYEGGISL